MSAKRTRRTFTAEEKAVILRRHLQDKVPVSDLCDEYGIRPGVFYTWQRQLLENMASVLDSKRRSRRQALRERKLERENEALREKLAKKNSVIAEISEEYVSLKKELGEL